MLSCARCLTTWYYAAAALTPSICTPFQPAVACNTCRIPLQAGWPAAGVAGRDWAAGGLLLQGGV